MRSLLLKFCPEPQSGSGQRASVSGECSFTTHFYRSMFGIALWTQPVWNSMQFNRTGKGSPLPWGPSKVLEGTGTSPYPGDSRWGILGQRTFVLIAGIPYLGTARPSVVLRLPLAQPVLEVGRGAYLASRPGRIQWLLPSTQPG